MSIARFTDDSDVYVFLTADEAGKEFWCCCGCVLNEQSWFCVTPERMIAHLREHANAGDQVPNYAFESLEAA